ncbi:hypothetical protein ASE74_19840 [Pedobacter sp. Leaf216]|nr:hypothetical protein ASE74_19840 [Pedobacter sp. Leaf216]
MRISTILVTNEDYVVGYAGVYLIAFEMQISSILVTNEDYVGVSKVNDSSIAFEMRISTILVTNEDYVGYIAFIRMLVN